MPGFIPGIHAPAGGAEIVDGRNKSGHDECKDRTTPAYFSPTLNGGSLPAGVVSSAIASIIATMT